MAEVAKVQQDALRKTQVLMAKHAATNKKAHDAATATSSHVQHQQEVSQICADADAEADAAAAAATDAMQDIITAERAKNHKIYKGCEKIAIENENKLKSQHAEEVTALKEQVQAEQKKRKRAQTDVRAARVSGYAIAPATRAVVASTVKTPKCSERRAFHSACTLLPG